MRYGIFWEPSPSNAKISPISSKYILICLLPTRFGCAQITRKDPKPIYQRRLTMDNIVWQVLMIDRLSHDDMKTIFKNHKEYVSMIKDQKWPPIFMPEDIFIYCLEVIAFMYVQVKTKNWEYRREVSSCNITGF